MARKKKKKQQPQNTQRDELAEFPAPSDEEFVGLPDPRAMERQLADITHLLMSQDFESMEDAQVFLDRILTEGKGIPPAPPEPETPVEQAQEIAYEAFAATGKKRAQLARKALKVSADCADAYVLLAEETAADVNEALDLYEKGVHAGERALGPEMFEDNAGAFWGIIETRPYMRARLGFASCLWSMGECQHAIEHYTDMIRLNPDDNQGNRYTLAGWLLQERQEKELGELLERYPDDMAASWAYTRALWLFRQGGASRKANTALKEAVEMNPFVPPFFLGQQGLPEILPSFMGFGDESEASAYVMDGLPGWLQTPRAIDWLREHVDEELGGAKR